MRFLFRSILWLFRMMFRVIFVLLIGVVGLTVAAYFYPVVVVGFLLQQGLALSGYPDARFQIDEISTERIQLTSVDLGQNAPSIQSASVTYNIGEVWRGRLQSVTVDGIRTYVDATQSYERPSMQLSFPWLVEPVFNSGAVVTIRDSVTNLSNTPIGDIVFEFDGEADFSQSPAMFNVRMNARPGAGESSLRAFSFDGSGSASPSEIEISGPTEVAFSNGQLGVWGIDRLSYSDAARLSISEQSLLFVLEAPVDIVLTHLVEATGEPQSEPLSIELRTGTTELNASWKQGLTGGAVIRDGFVEVDAWQLRGEGIDLAVPFEGEHISGTAAVTGRVIDLAPTARFTPQNIGASMLRDGDVFFIDGSAAPIGFPALLNLTGHYDLSNGTGSFKIGPDTLRFLPGGLQPQDLSPLLSLLQNTTGAVEIDGAITMEPDGSLKSPATVTLVDLKSDISAFSAVGISGRMRLRDIFNPRTPPGQKLTANRITAPIPMEDPELVFHWVRSGNDPVVRIESAEAKFADGTIGVETTSIRLGAEEYKITLVFDGISLETLFKDWGGGRVSGTGRLSGAIPVTLGPDGPIITEGELVAEEDGFIKVHWGEERESLEAQGQEVALMVQALDNFQYRVLKVGVRRPANDELGLLVVLEGANPKVLNGYPFRINANISGDLEEVLNALATGQALTQDLLRARMKDAN